VLLAGGTGGLGGVTARLLANDGFQVVLSYRSNAARAEGLAEFGIAMQAEPLYGLVVFAGDPARIPDFEVACRLSFEVNFLGPVMLAREAAERMKAAGVSGSIVLISTMQAVSVFPGSTAYASQKTALTQAALILAKECRGKTDIRVNVVCPGVNQAGMAEQSIASGKYAKYLDDGVISRYGRAEDVARAVRFLLEPDSYITGQVLTIDGGLTL
jgi:NAD(P)-dependent dehydrogenase (short-subunit alcohol dehydrogenase family)